jgi:putative acetyltransferase
LSNDSILISRGDLTDPRVIALLQTHLDRARAETAPGSAHALDISGLQVPAVSFFTVWHGDQLAGCGALKALSPTDGELKSMHTAEALRGRGIGGAMVAHLLDHARLLGIVRVHLETGSWPYFAPARQLYARHGFVECGPFGDYVADANSVFMTLSL